MDNFDKQLSYSNIEKKLDKIIRDSQLSDYEKKLRIEAEIIIPLLDKIDEIEKKAEELLGCISY